MIIRCAAALAVFAAASSTAAAQPLFDDPFADASVYRDARGDLAPASYRVRYEVTRAEQGGAPVVGELTLDIGPDWSLQREGDEVVLRDFRLNRMFFLQADRFTTQNGLADVTFRVLERQNRTFLMGVLEAAGGAKDAFDACDADAELGLALPGQQTVATFREERGEVVASCAGRDMGRFAPSDAPAPPDAFWPTMFSVMASHPGLFERVRESGVPPARLATSFRVSPEVSTERVWRLVAAETVATPYPLTESMRNTTAESLDELVAPGAGQLAVDAVAGRAQGGAPTLESWGAHLEEVSRTRGPAAAAMLLLPSVNMFPELSTGCRNGLDHPHCTISQGLAEIAEDDPAPMAVLQIGMAEQSGDNAAAIAAMQSAQGSPLGDDPALGAAFGLALLKFEPDELEQTRAALLPTDVAALQARALMALPYNPAYWTDIGDSYGEGYRWDAAFLFYDVAESLPMPDAVANNIALTSKRQAFERIRNDFPDAFLER